jgi:Dolichyl-phosphate-mannose-protein mannosyltransferase
MSYRSNERPSRFAVAGLPLAGFAFLVFTAALSITWSYCKLVWLDEFLVLTTDSTPSFSQIVHIQKAYPISLDPLAYHAVAHAAILAFGPNAFSIRLPSLVGFLVMQVCLFVFVRRIASERAAVFALAFPALTDALYFSAEGRPYSMMLGLTGLAMISWQSATRSESRRTVALGTMAVALALILNCHYSGVLLLVPFYFAELSRTLKRRAIDMPVVIALAVGSAGIIFAIPFARAAAKFRTHIDFALNLFPLNQLKPQRIIWTYPWLLGTHPLGQGIVKIFNVAALTMVVMVVIAAFWIFALRWRRGTLPLPSAEAVFLVVLTALPLSSLLLSVFVTHTYEDRYSLALIIGIAALTAIGLSSLLEKVRPGNVMLVAMFVAIAYTGIVHISIEHKSAQQVMASLRLNQDVKDKLMAEPTKDLYIEMGSRFATAAYYEPDPEIRSRLALVYSQSEELLWDNMDTISLTADHMRNFTNFKIVPFESVVAQSGDHMFVDYGTGQWTWTHKALQASHASIKPIGSAVGGQLVSAQFLP